MKRSMWIAVALVMAAGLGQAGSKDAAETVTFAKSWEAAVEEAKLLNVPIVLHQHLFT